MVKNALEPRFEAELEAHSYGFRPGRCAHDAIAAIFTALNDSAVGRNRVILDADIRSCTLSVRIIEMALSGNTHIE